jgi:hypothetical protein
MKKIEIEASSLDGAIALAYIKLTAETAGKQSYRVEFMSIEFRTHCLTPFIYVFDVYPIE